MNRIALERVRRVASEGGAALVHYQAPCGCLFYAEPPKGGTWQPCSAHQRPALNMPDPKLLTGEELEALENAWQNAVDPASKESDWDCFYAAATGHMAALLAAARGHAEGVRLVHEQNLEIGRLCGRDALKAAQIADLKAALYQYVDEEQCRYNHHQECETHGGSSPCANVQARRALGLEERKP